MDTSTTPSDLIDHIVSRFHEAHRRELPAIVQLARDLEARGAAPLLADDLDAMAQALELHMFKEEMRLFPMMEQGGNTLIVHLIDDIQADHRMHVEVVAGIQQRLSRLLAPGAEPVVAALRRALAKLFDDLEQHMHLEDDVLFPMLIGRAAT